jgi:hypothetical protein
MLSVLSERNSHNANRNALLLLLLLLLLLIFKSPTFWDIKPCNSLKVKRRISGKYYLHLQGRKISQARKQRISIIPRTDLV